MSARWKRNAVVVTMALLVCAAVALNWKYTGEQAAETVEETGTKILGEATLVSGQEDGGEAAADEEAVYTGDDYFASARLTRQQARAGTPSPCCRRRRTSPVPTRPWPTRPLRASPCWRATP